MHLKIDKQSDNFGEDRQRYTFSRRGARAYCFQIQSSAFRIMPVTRSLSLPACEADLPRKYSPSGIMRVRTLSDSLTTVASSRSGRSSAGAARRRTTIPCGDIPCGENSPVGITIDTFGPSPSNFSPSSSVKFDQIVIREYDMVVGDNPSCSGGAPVR